MQNLQHLLAAAKKNKPVTRVSSSADSMRSQGASKHDPKKTCGGGLQVENARMLRAKFTELQASILLVYYHHIMPNYAMFFLRVKKLSVEHC